MLVQHSVVIHRPVEEVFAALVNFEAEPVWPPGVLRAWYTPPGPVRLGTRTYQVRLLAGRRREATSIITAFALNRKMVSMSTSEGSPAVCTTYLVDPMQSGARLTVSIELEIEGASKMVAPLLKYKLIRDVTQRFAALKQWLEGQPGGAVTGTG